MNEKNLSTQPVDERSIAAYFLGDLTADEAARFEEACFRDHELAEQIFAVEGELIEDYVWNRLSAEERSRFEQNYLTSDERVDRVKFAAALCRQLSAEKPSTPEATPRWWTFWIGWPGWSYAFLLLAVSAVGLWMLLPARAPEQIVRVGDSASPTPVVTATPTPEATVTPSPRSERPMATPVTEQTALATLLLLPLSARAQGQGDPTLNLSSGVIEAELRPVFESNDFKNYRGELQTVAGNRVFLTPTAKARARRDGLYEVRLRVPASELRPQNYILLVFGIGDGEIKPENKVGDYSFQVIAK
jgi:hypothetical protein